MKRLHNILSAITLIAFLWGCEDPIYPELPFEEPVLVIDAWINNKPEPQVIKIKRTAPYFLAEELPGVTGAVVQIVDNSDDIYTFLESDTPGEYIWIPNQDQPLFGEVDLEYTLNVFLGEETFSSFSKMNRVPEIDSINYRFEPGNDFFPDSYFAGVFARDPVGPGDTYWIKAWKNSNYLSKPSEINIAYDAGFSAGSQTDGITFIQPIRDGINPFDQDEDDNFLPPYSPGDSVYVEIHSVTHESFFFLNEVAIQTDRPGGFAELFAQPLSNVPTNIVSVSSDQKVIGFFNVAAVSSAGRRLDPNNLPKKE
jgi:hypothetical protein